LKIVVGENVRIARRRRRVEKWRRSLGEALGEHVGQRPPHWS
jgi:hypothetical protein